MRDAPRRLRCEYLENPVGLEQHQPRLSWWLTDDRPAEIQTAYHLLAASSPEYLTDEQGDLWDSGRVESGETAHIEYAGLPLKSRQRVWWQVRSYDSDGIPSPWSQPARFEIGLLQADDWRARWIATPLMGSRQTPVQVPALRREFELPQPVESARLYISALGAYDVEINGLRAIETELAPGWRDFRKRVAYQTYDVTGLLDQGSNALGVLLADGWYCGFLGMAPRQQYGDRPELLVQLEVILADGTPLTITSDHQWQWQRSEILSADLMQGESIDARQRLGGWSQADYDPQGWYPVEVTGKKPVQLQGLQSPPITVVEEIQPIGEPTQRRDDGGGEILIYDLGQNIAGRARVRMKLPRGTLVRFRYAERLTAEGDLYTENLRSAAATDYYTARGDIDGETFEPRFTFHGFQFLEVSGRFVPENIESVCARVISSSLTTTGEFECDHPLISQLQNNIFWSQRGNFLDVPTDCPQRSERLGWTGDAQAFARTAAFNMNVAGFFGKWMTDLRDAQKPDGRVPPVAPMPPDMDYLDALDGGPAWSDAMVICPWTVYRCFGDRRILEQNFPAMKAFIDNLETRYPSLIRSDGSIEAWQGFGDWLATDGSPDSDQRFGNTPKDLIGTAFFCYSAKLLARIAGVLGNLSDLEKYESLAQRIRAAFRRRFVSQDGLLVGDTQTAYVLALHFGLLELEEQPAAVAHLVADIERRNYHLSTGFVGTPYLLPVLTAQGYLHVAYKLLLQTSWPSWLYPVTQGATTIWERWDGWTEEKGFQDPAMNSFNHYAYGAVGEWLYGTLAGLELDTDLSPSRNAYRSAHIHPHPPVGEQFDATCPIRRVAVSLDSEHGRWECRWEIQDDLFILTLRVPANCEAQVTLPNGESSRVTAGRFEFSQPLVEREEQIPVLQEISGLAS